MTEQLNKNNLFNKRNDASGEDLETWKPECSCWDIKQRNTVGSSVLSRNLASESSVEFPHEPVIPPPNTHPGESRAGPGGGVHTAVFKRQKHPKRTWTFRWMKKARYQVQ